MSLKDQYLGVDGVENFLSFFSRSIRQLRANYNELFSHYEESVRIVSDQKESIERSIKYGEEKSKELRSALSSGATFKREYEKASQRCKDIEGELKVMAASMAELQSRYNLVCSATSPMTSLSDRYLEFRRLVDHKLLPLINRVTVVPNEAEQMMRIRSADDEFRLSESLSSFSERTVVAVAGGFSSGKSSFITSLFLSDDLSLPIGIEPVTAIPTYVFHADKPVVSGYPSGGGCFEIPQHIYSRLSHKFVEEFGFNLRDLLPFISLEVPMESCRNLAFIDLPGYNPGERGGSTGGDRSASDEYLNQAQSLIWMIGLDSSGTIPRDDLEHLWDLAENNTPLYVVLNKADLRPESTLDDVLDQVADELEMAGIPYEGLCAYSSEYGGELAFRKRPLFEVLDEWDRPRSSTKHVMDKIEAVLSSYEQALKEDIDNRKKKRALVKALELNLLELGAFEEGEIVDFNVNKYMEENNGGARDSDFRKTPVSGWMYQLSAFHGLKNSDKSKVGSADKEDHQVILDKDNPDQELSLVEKVRDQISSLRLDYGTKQSERDLEDLESTRSAFLRLLT